MSYTCFRLGQLAFMIFLFAGCSSNWPSTDQVWRTHFLENRLEFDRMAERLEASPYAVLKRKNALEIAFASLLEGDATQGSEILARRTLESELEPVSNEADWRELFDLTGFHSVEIVDGVFSGNLSVATKNRLAGELADEVYPLYIRGYSGEKYACEAWHRTLDCGKCYQRMNDEWGVQYSWADYETPEPSRFDPDTSIEDQLAAKRLFGVECIRKGYEAIGYHYEEGEE